MADDENLQRITILLQARDRDMQRTLDRNNRLISKFTSEADRDLKGSAKEIDANLKRVVANTDRITASISSASVAASGFARDFVSGLALGAATAGVGMLTTGLRQTVRSVAEIGDQAKRAGLGVEEFQQWSFVAQQNRIEIDAVIDGFKELQLRADEYVVTGAGSAAEAFERLGFSAQDLSDEMKDPSEMMLEIFGRMRDLDRAAQIRVFDELLGGQGGERFVELIAQGEDGIRTTLDVARQMGLVLQKEWIDRAAEIDRKFTALQQRFTVGIQESLIKAAEDFENVLSFGDTKITIGDIGDFVDARREAAAARDEVEALASEHDKLAEAAAQAAIEFASAAAQADLLGNDQLWSVLANGASDMRDLADQFGRGAIDGETLAQRMADIQSAASDAFAALSDADRVDFSLAVSEVDRLGRIISAVSGMAQRLSSAVASAAGAPVGEHFGPVQEVWRNPDDDLPNRATQRPERPSFEATENWAYGYEEKGGKGKGKDKDKKEEYKARAEAIREETAALEVEAIAMLAVAGSNMEYADAVEYARRRAELLHAAQRDGIAITPELRTEIDALAQAYADAGEKARGVDDDMRRVEEAAERGADAMSDIFFSVLDGSSSAKEAIGQLLMEMAKVQLQNAVLGMGGGGGAFGFIGSLLTPLAGKRRKGGPVSAGSPYLVNEDTPNSEVFVPSQSGAILNVPQAQAALRGAGGQVTRSTVIYRNETTVDLRGTTGDRELDAKLKRWSEETLQQTPAYINEHNQRTA